MIREPSELEDTRRLIASRRARQAEVRRRHEAFDSRLRQGRYSELFELEERCLLGGHDRGRPKIYRVALTDFGLLYQAEIPWVPSDQLTLRPWLRQDLLGTAIGEAHYASLMSDDEALSDWLDHLDGWAEGHESTGPRWLAKGGPHVVLEVLDLTDHQEGALELWARCPKHPDGERVPWDRLLQDARDVLAQLAGRDG